MALRDAFADLLDPGTPANAANSAKTRADTGPQPDSGGCESLRILRISDGPAAKFAEFADIRKPENNPQSRANACDSQNSQHSQGPYRLSKDAADRCHTPCWNDAEIETFVTRVSLFMRRGINATDCDDLAERLTLRDRDDDDRRLCLECSYYRPGRCGNHLAAGLGGPALPQDLATRLQGCPGFKP